MSGWDGAGSIYAVRMRLTRLDTDGSPLVGTKNMIVSDALIKASYTPQNDSGDEISQKNGSGALCLYYKAPDTLKSIDFELDLCTPDPEAQEMLSGGTVLVDGPASIGYAAPEVGQIAVPNGMAVELWSRAVINSAFAANLPFIHWVFPRLFLTQDQETLDNTALAPVFKGSGQENDGFGTGPMGDWEFESSRLWQWVREAGPLPTITNGYAAVADHSSS